MFITTEKEIISLMPTARWNTPGLLKGYLEEEERVALEPLLGTPLYLFLCDEYVRLKDLYGDITPATVVPTGESRPEAEVSGDVTERLEQIRQGQYGETYDEAPAGEEEVPRKDMQEIRLIRICQQIEFYRMLSHKAGLLTVSFNEGGGMNVVTAEGYDEAGDKRMERVVKDAFMSAGRATDSLLLFLEADAKGDRLFTELWQEADAFYLHRDLLFQTARMLNEYLDIGGDRMAYVQLVRDIRFCQNTYLRPRIGAKLLRAVTAYANAAPSRERERVVVEGGTLHVMAEQGKRYRSAGQVREYVEEGGTLRVRTDDDDRFAKAGRVDAFDCDGGEIRVRVGDEPSVPADTDYEAYDELLSLLRQALAFYVESRRTEIGQKGDRLARRDSMNDAQQAMAMACQFVEDNLDALGEAAEGSPIYNMVRERERQEKQDAADAEAARQRMCRERAEQAGRKLFTGFPATHRNPELK